MPGRGRVRREANPHRFAAAALRDLLKQRRVDLGLSQQTLAARAGVAFGTIRALESGRTVDPGLFTIVRIIEALELNLADVLDRVGLQPRLS